MATQFAGSNSLRGGKKKYGSKTKCGNWVELNKEPGQALPSGFPHAMYETDAHQQMLEGLLRKPKRLGAGLPPCEDPCIDYNRVMNYERRQGDSCWAAITSTEFTAPRHGREKDKEFTSSFKMAGGISDPIKLKEYREAWTVEADAVRPVRFKTDAVISANSGVPANFRMGQTRKLPGTPKALDRLLSKVLETGELGVVHFRQALLRSDSLGTALLKPCQLAEVLKEIGVSPLSEADSNKVIEFFSRGDKGATTAQDLLRGFHGPMSERRRRAVARTFRSLDETGTGVINEEDLRRGLDAACAGYAGEGVGCKGLEATSVLLENWGIYKESEGRGMTSAGFEAFLSDASCGIDREDDFEATVASLAAT